MATITIRNISDELVDRIKRLAEQKGISIEQEVRDLLQKRYGQRDEVLARIRERAKALPMESESQVQTWKSEGRL
ncbi:FitA-like ribbon-helix-helix domain-containing protein [Nostoc sp. DSM 114161]|jgi:plasmid stability protein|uniref:FitA-like ribbon-helix-helix domain-containing protein n=1 Tax=Nostoc sp. DSM 114161 TaxID=3440143 RepID=UPI0040457ECF